MNGLQIFYVSVVCIGSWEHISISFCLTRSKLWYFPSRAKSPAHVYHKNTKQVCRNHSYKKSMLQLSRLKLGMLCLDFARPKELWNSFTGPKILRYFARTRFFMHFSKSKNFYKHLCSSTKRNFNFSAGLRPSCLALKTKKIFSPNFEIFYRNFWNTGPAFVSFKNLSKFSVSQRSALWENSVYAPKKDRPPLNPPWLHLFAEISKSQKKIENKENILRD